MEQPTGLVFDGNFYGCSDGKIHLWVISRANCIDYKT